MRLLTPRPVTDPARLLVRRAALAAAVVLATGAMGPTDCSTTCPTVTYPAAVVHVRDAATEAPLAEGVTVTLTNAQGAAVGRFDLQDAASGTFMNYAPAGSYRVTVTHAGYDTFTRDIVVRRTSGGCSNIIPVELDAPLVASSTSGGDTSTRARL